MHEDVVRYFFLQYFRGLEHCHIQGVTHRDLKPDNLLIDDKLELKIADFGFSAPFLGKTEIGYQTTYCGTPGYLAPEIIAGKPYLG